MIKLNNTKHPIEAEQSMAMNCVHFWMEAKHGIEDFENLFSIPSAL